MRGKLRQPVVSKTFWGISKEDVLDCFDFSRFGSTIINNIYTQFKNEYAFDIWVDSGDKGRILSVDEGYKDKDLRGITAQPNFNNIRIEEVRVHEDFRRAGIGKVFVHGLWQFLTLLDIDKIYLTAGREDGAIFWSRHGWRLITEQSLARFKEDIERNVEKAGDIFTDDERSSIQAIIENDDLSINITLARLFNDQAKMKALFHHIEARTVFDRRNVECVDALRMSLSRAGFRIKSPLRRKHLQMVQG